ncbi:zinc cadmium resistance [Fusarium heterosporum]|uniref:Zinc cadmium resistance n=1 Tax=Fusarium heterosporum TaxID=42747 RepID=A0A8H5SX37_FUSHE|nr:zinc cadmium resistance [Fusarium heterosporum]
MKVTKKQRLIATICISFSFFAAELAVGFYTHSIALIADAFHYLSDLIGIVVALITLMVQDRTEPAPQAYTYGWQRATILGAFFNGAFLLALGVSILVQAVERFVHITRVKNPMLILIVGSIGLALNILVLSFLHGKKAWPFPRDMGNIAILMDCSTKGQLTRRQTIQAATNNHHGHKHVDIAAKSAGRDLGMMGVFIHILGDAINNVGVMAAAVIIWKAEGDGRYYADPVVGVFISVMILISAIPVVKGSGAILLQTAPRGIDLEDVKHDIERIPGVLSVHKLHIWRLGQHKSVASAHIAVNDRTIEGFVDKAKIIMECLHAYGVHSATLQPEAQTSSPVTTSHSAPESQAALIDANHGAFRPRGGE